MYVEEEAREKKKKKKKKKIKRCDHDSFSSTYVISRTEQASSTQL
jgi:hypothetical protein